MITTAAQESKPKDENSYRKVQNVVTDCTAIRMGHWKAVRLKRGGSWQLFDLEADGTETVDLAESQPERTKELAAQFDAWRERVGAQ